jgi:RNA polymerase sigma-54 factor
MSAEGMDIEMGREIIGDLDHNGYFQTDAREIAEKFYVPLEKVEEILFLIQGFHPAGVAARDLRECLLAQLSSQGKEDTIGYRIVETCLKDLEKGDDAGIAKKLRVKREDVAKARQLINSLEPKPGRMFAPGENVWAVPDIIIDREGGGFRVSLNERFLPKLRLSPYYLKLLKDKKADDAVKGFLEERKTRAQWVIGAILQRQDTIKKVAEYIVNVQKDFLDDPWSSVKPLKMGEIAEALGVSKSTVSRAVAKKYVQTEYGLLPLKRFFSTALMAGKGEDVSVDLVEKKIGEIIADEDKRMPLSDTDIAGRLGKDGINIARRTVAKYRKNLGIAAASRRRKKRKG